MTWPAGPSPSIKTWCLFGSAGTSVWSIARRPSCSSEPKRPFSISAIPFTHSFSFRSSGVCSKARARLSIAGKIDSKSWMFA